MSATQQNAQDTAQTMAMLRTFIEETVPEVKEASQRSALSLEQIERMQTRLDELASERDELAKEVATLKRHGVGTTEKNQDEEPAARRALRSFIAKRGRLEELEPEQRQALKDDRHQRALDPLTATVAADGGVFAPADVRDEIIRYVNDTTNMLNICRVYRTNRGNMKVNSLRRRDTVSWKGTETAVDGTDALRRFGQVEFVPTRPKEMVYIDEDMLDDTERNIEEYVQREQGIYFADVLEWATMQGSGNGEPTGVTKAGLPTFQATTSTGQAFTSDDVITAVYRLRQGYRRGARFVMHRSAVRQARLLKDANDRYLWQESLVAGEPDRLAGYPVFESEYFPDHIADGNNAGEPVFVFGDFNYYGICLRRDFTVKIYDNDHSLGLEGQVGYRFDMRADTKPLFDEAFTVSTRS